MSDKDTPPRPRSEHLIPEPAERDEDMDRYRERFPALVEAWEKLNEYVRYRAWGQGRREDPPLESRSQEWTTTGLRLGKLGQRIRGVMDTASGRPRNALAPPAPDRILALIAPEPSEGLFALPVHAEPGCFVVDANDQMVCEVKCTLDDAEERVAAIVGALNAPEPSPAEAEYCCDICGNRVGVYTCSSCGSVDSVDDDECCVECGGGADYEAPPSILCSSCNPASPAEALRDEALRDRLGRGVIEIGLTIDGEIGVWEKHGDSSIVRGDTVSEVLLALASTPEGT